jgi:glycosyltransferase involved in cell wall biosynthesis
MSTETRFEGKVGVVQRVLPAYRAPFFDALASACAGGLSVFAGSPRGDEAIEPGTLRVASLYPGRNHHLAARGLLLAAWQSHLLRWLEATDPDALIVEANPRYLSTPAALRWMQSRHRGVIGWGLGAPALSGPLAPLRAARRRRLLRRFDALITYSAAGAAGYRALGFPAERIFIAPNAVTPRPTQPPPARADGFGARPLVLFVGRLQARKRVDNLFRACAALPQDIQPRVVVVGDGPARVDFEAAARQFYPQAEFAGAMHGAALDPYFDAADLFVLPGTGGLAVQQAMSHALPVIVAEADGTQVDLVRPGNGWQVPANNVPALTAALADALSDAPRLRRMGLESYRIVAEEINLENMVAVFVRALQSVARR